MLATGHLPRQLVLLLSNPNIIKVGRMVSSDLKYLEIACHSSTPFTGALDLARYAKERLVVSNAKASLADLCAATLQKRLPKNTSARISTRWEDDQLPVDMVRYAALDAYASLCIYQQLFQIHPPKPLPEKLDASLEIVLYHDDLSRVIARGHISDQFLSDKPKDYNGIPITAKRILITVTQVLVPGAIINAHRKRTLEAFGSIPFNLVCLRSRLKVVPSDANLKSLSFKKKLSPTIFDPLSGPQPTAETSTTNVLPIDSDQDSPPLSDLIFDTANTAELESQPNDESLPQLSTSPTLNHELDTQSAIEGDSILGPQPTEWTTIRSRIINDPFHLFNRFYIAAGHGLRIEFARAMRDALFIPDEEDKHRITAWGQSQKPPQTFDNLVQSRPAWVWRHCKRVIPPPEQLYPLIAGVFRIYGPLKDAKTGQPLFNSRAWHVAKNILTLIQGGYVSDPPGITLYTLMGSDSVNGGLPIYRCARGTNFTEGGVHTHLRSRLPTSGVSIHHLHACLLDFIILHNLLVCCDTLPVRNRVFKIIYNRSEH
jgi:hypothetical protein